MQKVIIGKYGEEKIQPMSRFIHPTPHLEWWMQLGFEGARNARKSNPFLRFTMFTECGLVVLAVFHRPNKQMFVFLLISSPVHDKSL